MTAASIERPPVASGLPRSRRRFAWLLAFAAVPLAALAWQAGPAEWLAVLVEPPAPVLSATGGIILALLAACAYTDLSWRKIYNWATYPAFLWALAVNLPADLWWSPERQRELGVVGPWACLLGALIGFFGLLVGYHLSGGGAGDVKIACALGAWLGPQNTIHLLVYTYAIGGTVLLSTSIWRAGPVHVLGGLCRRIGSALVPRWVAPPSEEQSLTLRQVVPLAPFFALGGALVLLGWIPK